MKGDFGGLGLNFKFPTRFVGKKYLENTPGGKQEKMVHREYYIPVIGYS